MKVDRKELLKTLTISAVGLTKREILEQSNSFVFTEMNLVAFNGEVFTKTKNPLPHVRGAVPAEDFLALLAKFPDDEIEVKTTESEIRIKGNKRAAGITMSVEVHLPYSDIPGPGEWKELPPELIGAILQASRVCGKDEAQPRTTEVHVTPDHVEACDNFRIFRATMETGMKGELLVPAASITSVGGIAFKFYSVKNGWLHFLTKTDGCRVSLRCSSGAYPDLSPFLSFKKPKKVKLPGNLTDILARAEIMKDYNSLVHISIADGEITVKVRKDSGWMSERKSVEYADDPLKFEVNLTFLQEVLAKTRNVQIEDRHLRIKSGNTVAVLCLEVVSE